MAHTYTEKGRFSLFKGKRDRHTCTLFKLDNEALMDDRHETMRNSYCTNRHLEKLMNYPEEEQNLDDYFFINENLVITCRIPAAVNGENCE